MSQAPDPAGTPPAPPEARRFLVAPARFVMPEGHVPDPYFVLEAPHEKLVLSFYSENRDGGSAAVLAQRLKDLELSGLNFVLERKGSAKIDGRAASLMVISTGNGKDKYTVCIGLVGMEPRRFWDVRYEFEFPGEGGAQEFGRLLGALRFPGSVPPDPAPEIPEDRQHVDLFGLRAILPSRLRRTSAYTFRDAAAEVSWSVDACWNAAKLSTIAPEPVTPMIKEVRRQDISQDSISGTAIQSRCTNPGTGRPGDFILRADVVIARQAHAILRGQAPGTAAARLDADLDFLLRNASLEKEA
jgi:hypothetical protein